MAVLSAKCLRATDDYSFNFSLCFSYHQGHGKTCASPVANHSVVPADLTTLELRAAAVKDDDERGKSELRQ